MSTYQSDYDIGWLNEQYPEASVEDVEYFLDRVAMITEGDNSDEKNKKARKLALAELLAR